MARFLKKISKTAGHAPGDLVYVGEKRVEKPRITIIDYDEVNFKESQAKAIDECFPFKETPTVTWINIDGLQEIEIIEKVGKHFQMHPLTMEDILNTGQRPKYEDFDDYIFLVLKMLYFDDRDKEIKAEHVSVIVGANFVISFQEKEGDVFNPIRERIRNNKGRVRKMGADYLAYTLLDAIVDSYYAILEKSGEKIESMEDELVKNPTPELLRLIHRLKGDAIFLRKSVWPLREVVNSLTRSETKIIQKATEIYLRDVYDHTIQVIDMIETFRDTISGMLDIYLSSLSNKMNEVMKVLTIIATIFIPITFIAGIYGMNFDPSVSKFNMPELGWPFGYVFAWGVMILITIVMLVYFRKKRWL